LVAAFDLLPPKGRLAYLTCTLNRKENEDQIDWLLSTQPQARLESDWTTPESSNLAEFFFAALVYKTGND
jgi:16S rRNA (cytosine967-C5)-methyltransferase